MSKIVLYDLPSKGRNACWSLNPWKTRLSLNFKGIDYETVWVEYPDVETTLSPHVPKNASGPADYTIPTVKLLDGTYIMDSKSIAARLEKDYPSPPLYLDSPNLAKVEGLLASILGTMKGIWCAQIPTTLLNEPSKVFFERTRAKRFGMDLVELQKKEGGEEAWIAALPELKKLGEVIKANGGPFVEGENVSFADFVILGWLHFYKRIDEKLFERVCDIEPAFALLYEAGKKWLARDDH